MITQAQVLDLARLPDPSHGEVMHVLKTPEGLATLTGVENLVIFVDPDASETILQHPTVGPYLQSYADVLFITGKKKKRTLRANPVTIPAEKGMGSLKLLHVTTGGKLAGTPQDDTFDVPRSWRDATAALQGLHDNLQSEDRHALAFLLGETVITNTNAGHVVRAIARALGNLGYQKGWYESRNEERHVDGKLGEGPVPVVPDVAGRQQQTRFAVEKALFVTEGDSSHDADLSLQFKEGDDVSRMHALCNFLAYCPHNLLDCQTFVRVLQRLTETARKCGANMEIEIYGPENTPTDISRTGSLQDLRLNALTAVHAGASEKEVGPFLVRIKYRYCEASNAPVHLVVTKSIMQDDGGHCAKGAGALDMQADMGGGAMGAAIVARLGEEKPKRNIDVVFSIATNTADAGAYRVNDIVTLASGVTAKIINTDAEGRLVLADAGGAVLQLHRKEDVQTGQVTTIATLTGHARVVGGDHSLVISGDRAIRRTIEDDARTRGESLEGMMFAPVDDALISGEELGVDLLNVGAWPVGPSGTTARGAQTAARFIYRGMRINQLPFVHFDVAPDMSKSRKAPPQDLARFPMPFGNVLDTVYAHVTGHG